jgi:hypothetical protein
MAPAARQRPGRHFGWHGLQPNPDVHAPPRIADWPPWHRCLSRNGSEAKGSAPRRAMRPAWGRLPPMPTPGKARRAPHVPVRPCPSQRGQDGQRPRVPRASDGPCPSWPEAHCVRSRKPVSARRGASRAGATRAWDPGVGTQFGWRGGVRGDPLRLWRRHVSGKPSCPSLPSLGGPAHAAHRPVRGQDCRWWSAARCNS